MTTTDSDECFTLSPWGKQHPVLWLEDNLDRFAVSPDQVFDNAVTEYDWGFAGVYFLIRDDMLQYIGKTSEWGQRYAAHNRNGRRFDEGFFLPVPPDIAELVENTYLNLAMPPENVRYLPSSNCLPLRRRLIELDWGTPEIIGGNHE